MLPSWYDPNDPEYGRQQWRHLLAPLALCVGRSPHFDKRGIAAPGDMARTAAGLIDAEARGVLDDQKACPFMGQSDESSGCGLLDTRRSRGGRTDLVPS